MSKSRIFSDAKQLQQIAKILSAYMRLPFSGDSIPGALMEYVLAFVRGGEVLRTYDFVDVVDRKGKVGWQVKSTKDSTPVTWKRAKIPNAAKLIAGSRQSPEGIQTLGDQIITFCNEHAKHSLDAYGLDEIGYSRLILTGKSVVYFERELCSRDNPRVFKAEDFAWRWSDPKVTKKKEQLSALHGKHTPTGKKWFAWHGLGENQLHFSGESEWWLLPSDERRVEFEFTGADGRVDMEVFMELLNTLSKTSDVNVT